MTRPWPAAWRIGAPGAPCQVCGERTGRPMLMGMQSPDAFEALDAGKVDIELASCRTSDEGPTHRFASCSAGFAVARSGAK